MMAVLAAVALLGADVAAPPSPLIGRWRTEKRNGIVELAPCGSAICGKVLDGAPLRANPDQRDVRNRDAALRARRVMGLRVLEGFTGGPRTWTGGPMYDPDTGDGASSGYLTLLNPDTLQVKGCIVAFLCRTQTWTRIR